MKPTKKLYLIAFLVTGIPFAALMTLFDVVWDNGEFSPWKFVFHGLFYGGFMSLILVTLHKRRLKKMGVTDMNNENLSVKQFKEVNFDISKDDLLNLIKSDTFFKKMKIIESDRVIEIKAKISWKSWGENITIEIIENDKDLNTFKISSKPTLSTTIVDYGKNKENVDRIELLINRKD